MISRLSPLALVMLAACSGGGDAASLPPAVTPQELLEFAIESPGDGSDIMEAVERFGSAEAWRNAPAGVVVSKRAGEVILDTHGKSESAPVQEITTPEKAPE